MPPLPLEAGRGAEVDACAAVQVVPHVELEVNERRADKYTHAYALQKLCLAQSFVYVEHRAAIDEQPDTSFAEAHGRIEWQPQFRRRRSESVTGLGTDPVASDGDAATDERRRRAPCRRRRRRRRRTVRRRPELY